MCECECLWFAVSVPIRFYHPLGRREIAGMLGRILSLSVVISLYINIGSLAASPGDIEPRGCGICGLGQKNNNSHAFSVVFAAGLARKLKLSG